MSGLSKDVKLPPVGAIEATWESFCYSCGAATTKRCAQCKYARFCNTTCQSRARDCHRKYCVDPRLMEETESWKKRRGLPNIGNTCYCAAPIQVLAHCGQLRRYFLQGFFEKHINKVNPLGCGGNFAKAFCECLAELWFGVDGKYSDWQQFLRTIRTYHSEFNDYDQHDAQELLSYVLDKLHEDLNKVQRKAYVEIAPWQAENEPLHEAAIRFRQTFKARDDSVIHDLFGGMFRNQVTCMTCGHSSVRFERFCVLSLPVPPLPLYTWRVIFFRLPLGARPIVTWIGLPYDATVGSLRDTLSTRTHAPPERLVLGVRRRTTSLRYGGPLAYLNCERDCLPSVPDRTLLVYEAEYPAVLNCGVPMTKGATAAAVGHDSIPTCNSAVGLQWEEAKAQWVVKSNKLDEIRKYQQPRYLDANRRQKNTSDVKKTSARNTKNKLKDTTVQPGPPVYLNVKVPCIPLCVCVRCPPPNFPSPPISPHLGFAINTGIYGRCRLLVDPKPISGMDTSLDDLSRVHSLVEAGGVMQNNHGTPPDVEEKYIQHGYVPVSIPLVFRVPVTASLWNIRCIVRKMLVRVRREWHASSSLTDGTRTSEVGDCPTNLSSPPSIAGESEVDCYGACVVPETPPANLENITGSKPCAKPILAPDFGLTNMTSLHAHSDSSDETHKGRSNITAVLDLRSEPWKNEHGALEAYQNMDRKMGDEADSPSSAVAAAGSPRAEECSDNETHISPQRWVDRTRDLIDEELEFTNYMKKLKKEELEKRLKEVEVVAPDGASDVKSCADSVDGGSSLGCCSSSSGDDQQSSHTAGSREEMSSESFHTADNGDDSTSSASFDTPQQHLGQDPQHRPSSVSLPAAEYGLFPMLDPVDKHWNLSFVASNGLTCLTCPYGSGCTGCHYYWVGGGRRHRHHSLSRLRERVNGDTGEVASDPGRLTNSPSGSEAESSDQKRDHHAEAISKKAVERGRGRRRGRRPPDGNDDPLLLDYISDRMRSCGGPVSKTMTPEKLMIMAQQAETFPIVVAVDIRANGAKPNNARRRGDKEQLAASDELPPWVPRPAFVESCTGLAPQSRSCIDLEQLLKFQREEILTGGDAWKCEKCSVRSEAMKVLDLWDTGEILLIHFMRFKYNGREEKIPRNICYPLEGLRLDVANRDVVTGEPSSVPAVYDLCGVICHFGTMGRGHYYSYCRTNEDWVMYDDDMCLLATGNVQSAEAYILAYERRSA